MPLSCYRQEYDCKQASIIFLPTSEHILSDDITFKKKNSENRMQSQTGLNYAEAHPVLRSAKNSENRMQSQTGLNYAELTNAASAE